MNTIIREDITEIIASDLPWSEFAGKTLLVSGAAGMLPAYMIETLLSLGKGVRVLALVRNEKRARERFGAYIARGDLRLIVQDVCASLHWDGWIDYIIHAASQASPKYFGIDPVGTLSANVLGTHNMLTLAREHRVKGFLFFSSGEVYGQVSEEHIPTKEDQYGYLDPTDLRSCYGESKRLGETMCVSWQQQYGVPVKIVRPFHTYGPGMRLDDGRVFADFVANIVKGEDIILKGDGRATRAFCYLTDATRGFFTILIKGEAGQAYNIGNPHEEVSILELAERLAALPPARLAPAYAGGGESTHAPGYIESRISRSCPDISKARALGWEPRVSIEEGFARTVKSFGGG